MLPKIEILPLLEEIERQKGIKKQQIVKFIEDTISEIYEKHLYPNSNIKTTIDLTTGEMKIKMIKKVVKEVKNDKVEISLEEALRLKPGTTLEKEIEIELDISEIPRVSAQMLRQAIIQKIKELELEELYNSFKSKEGEIVPGQIYKFLGKDIIVDLGKGLEAILPFEEQIPYEKFRIGETIKAIILKVEKEQKEIKIVLSRAKDDFIIKLFKREIPEIQDLIVEIKKIIRKAGVRTKIALISNDPKVDPVGTCVGLRGSRIKPIIKELKGEKIDLIAYSDDPKKYISEALSPAKPIEVIIDDFEKKRATAIVDEESLALAYGKNNENLLTAQELTGWQINIKSTKEVKKEKFVNLITEKFFIPKDTAEKMYKEGYKSIQDLKKLTPKELRKYKITEETFKMIEKYEKEEI